VARLKKKELGTQVNHLLLR